VQLHGWQGARRGPKAPWRTVTAQPLGRGLLRTQAKEHRKMPLLNLVVVLVVVGVLLYLVNSYIPMAGSIKTILNIVVVVAVCVWVLQAVGLWGPVSNFRLRPGMFLP